MKIFIKKLKKLKIENIKFLLQGKQKWEINFYKCFLGEDILPTGFIQCTSSIIEIKRSKDGKKRLISEEVGGGKI